MSTAELGAQYGQVSQYDKRGRMTNRYSINLAGFTVLADQWAFDPAGNVKHAVDSAQGDFAYTYDNLNRVTSAVIPPFTEGYSYDPWGNQTTRTVTQGTGFQWNYTPTTSNQATGSGMTYDAAGNLLTDGLHSYSYDAESRVAAVPDQSVQYRYDPEGLRVATVAGGAVSAEYLYDMGGSLVTTVTNQGQMVRTILRDNGGMHWGDYIGSAGAGGLRTEFRLVNQVGTLVANGDTKGNFVEGCLSGPFGDGQLCTPSYDYTETHFTDKLRDAETENDYFGARYFNSTMGRFTSPDWAAKPEAVPYSSLDNPQSLNLYSYVNNNPLSKTDNDGHQEALPTPFGPLPLFFPQHQMTPQQAGQVAQGITGFVTTLGQVIHEDAAAVSNVVSSIFASSNSSSDAPTLVTPEVSPTTPSFVVTPSGDAVPIPAGASGPAPVVNDAGKTTGSGYSGGSGGAVMDPKVSDVRIMDPTPARGAAPAYPGGYVSYGNRAGQTVNPQTGRTVPKNDASAHIPLKSQR